MLKTSCLVASAWANLAKAVLGARRSRVAAALAMALGSFSAHAEPVAVNKGSGQGFIFVHRGNCYLILPQHVPGLQRVVSIVTAAPSVAGEAEIFRSFMPGADLSIALVRPGLEQRCTDDWSELPPRTDAVLDQSDYANLVRLTASGAEE